MYKGKKYKPTELCRNNLFLKQGEKLWKKYRSIIWDRWYGANKDEKQGRDAY